MYHSQGIRKAATVSEILKDKVVLNLELFCGAPMTLGGTDYILRKYSFASEDIVRLHYRGKGWPGYMTTRLKDGTEKLIPMHEYIIYHSLGFFYPLRCVLCYETMNELADIFFGGTWLPELKGDRVGTSAVICRSQAGNNLLQLALSKKIISLQNIDIKKVRLMESKNVWFQFTSRLYRLSGRKTPTYNITHSKAGSAPLFLMLFTSMMTCLCYPNLFIASKRTLRWLIEPVTVLEHILMKLGTRIVRLVRLFKSPAKAGQFEPWK